jgi:hypothetical protein
MSFFVSSPFARDKKKHTKCRFFEQFCGEPAQIHVSGLFDIVTGILMRLNIMEKPEWIYNVDDKGCNLSLFFLQ